jgi:YfiH family protein
MIKKISYPINHKFPDLICETLWIEDGNFESKGNQHLTAGNYLKVLSSVDYNINRIAAAEQIHGGKVMKTDCPGIMGDCDGLITQTTGLYLLIRTADCAAIFIYDAKNKVLANLHAGWRGLNKHILLNGMTILFNDYNSKPADIFVEVSPLIQSCCYRVGNEFPKLFPSNFFYKKEDKLFLDLKGIIFQQLIGCGIPEKQINLSDICTHCDPRLLPSHRRTKSANRMFNLMVLRDFFEHKHLS